MMPPHTVSAQRAPRRLLDASKWVVTLSVLFGAIMGAVDTSVVNVALVRIQATYGVTTQQVTWVTAAYLIAVVIVMPLTAWVATVFGRRRMYLMAVAIFTGASILCGVSRSLAQLIGFRILQGLGGGALQPTAQAIMRETFPADEQGQAMGFFGMIVLLGPAIGPTLGGWLTDRFSWPWIFFVNVPIGVIALVLGVRFIVDPPYMRGRGVRRIDAIGIGLLAVGLASLEILLEQGEAARWFASPAISTLALVALGTLTAFVVWELRTPAPAVELRILRNTTYASGAFIGGVLGLALFGSLLLLPLFLQTMLHYGATRAGLALMPRSLTMVFLMPIAGILYNRLGVYIMLPFGMLMSALAAFLMGHFTLASDPLQIVVPQVVQGIEFAFMFVALSTATLATIPPSQMQTATGLYNLVRQLGGSLGTAIVITVLNHRITTVSATLGMDTARSGGDPRHISGVLSGLLHTQAVVASFNYTFMVIGGLFLICLPLVLLMRRGRLRAQHETVLG